MPEVHIGGSTSFCGVGGLAYSNLGTSGTPASHVETTLKSYTLPALALGAGNNGFARIKAIGKFAATANAKTLKIKMGSVTMLVVTALTTPGDALGIWYFDGIICGSQTEQGTTGQIVVMVTGNTVAYAGSNFGSGTEDGTAPIIIAVTGQNDSADAANDVTCEMLVVEFLNTVSGVQY